MDKSILLIALLLGSFQAKELKILRSFGNNSSGEVLNSSLYGYSDITACFRFFQDFFPIPDSDELQSLWTGQGVIDFGDFGIGGYAFLPFTSKYATKPRTIIKNQGWREGETYGIINKHLIFFKSWEIQRWNSACLTISNETLDIFINGERQALTSTPKVKTSTENLKIFGFYIIGGKFRSEWKSFLGSITDLNLWSRTLPTSELADYAECLLEEEGDLLAWEEVQWTGEGIVEELWEQNTVCKIGDSHSHIIVPSTVRRTFEEGAEYCGSVMKGELAVAEDSDSTLRMVEAFQSLPQWSSKCFYKLYSGFVRYRNDTAFINPNSNQRVANLSWVEGEPVEVLEDKICPQFDIRVGANLNTDCYQSKCSLCKVVRGSLYHLRGVCNKDTWGVDIIYVLTDNRTFTGNIRSRIVWDLTGLRWEIQDLDSQRTVAQMNETSDYPFGVHRWYFLDGSCHDPGSPLRSLHLHLPVLLPGEFCCNSGACIASSLVCDHDRHCDDHSDEQDCQVVDRGLNYERNKPPRTSYKKDGRWWSENTNILVDVIIEYLLDLNEEEASIKVLFITKLSWRDLRLTYTFLKERLPINSITENLTDLWTPHITYTVLLESRLVSKDLFVRRTGQPTLSRELSVSPASQIGKVKGQYVISDWRMEETRGREGDAGVLVTVTLTRELSAVFLVTYLPTILMNIINQSTVYITFDLMITVNITCMMVLASVYLSVSASLPSTPVIKPVECLSYPFFIIVMSTLEQVCSSSGSEEKGVRPAKMRTVQVKPKEEHLTQLGVQMQSNDIMWNLGKALLDKSLKIYLPLVYVSLCVLYWIYYAVLIKRE